MLFNAVELAFAYSSSADMMLQSRGKRHIASARRCIAQIRALWLIVLFVCQTTAGHTYKRDNKLQCPKLRNAAPYASNSLLPQLCYIWFQSHCSKARKLQDVMAWCCRTYKTRASMTII